MTTPSIGPVELLVVKFPGNQFKGEIAPALNDLVKTGQINIIDLLFGIKDESGDFRMIELDNLAEPERALFAPIVKGGTVWLSESDIQAVGDILEPNSSAALLLFENVWAIRFRDALKNANAEMIFNVRIPNTVIQEFLDDQAVEAKEGAGASA